MGRKLFRCTTEAFIRRINKYFNETFPEEEGINIYDDITLDEIIRRLNSPCELCKCCSYDTLKKFYLPEKSKRDK